jgi:glycosyltransferase involved in cell wall biosynthesis
MKKVLFIIWCYSLGGGAESLLTTIVNNLNIQKYKIGIMEVWHTNVKREPVNSNITIYDSITFEGDPEYRKKMYYIYNNPEKIIKKYVPSDYDIYVSFNYQVPSFLLPSGCRNIAWIHSDVYDLSGKIGERYRNLQAAVFHKAQKIVSISTFTTQSLTELFPEYSDKVVEIFNGIDIYRVRGLSEKKTNIRLADNSVIFIGRMDDRKNPLRMLEIFKGVYERNESVHLYFLGKGELEFDVKKKVNEYGLQEQVHFLGYIENPFPIIKQADICCMTSKSEGFPMSLLESVSLHVPFVSTEVGGADILANEGRCGKTYRTNEEAVDSIIDILRTPKEIFVRECEQSIWRFDLDTYISKIEELFDELLVSDIDTDGGTIWDSGQGIDELEERNYYYRFPEGLIENGKKVILYGAGDIGKNYYQYMQEKNIWDLVAWVDAAAEKYKNLCNNVQSVDIITKLEFDVILIAVMEEKTAQSIHRSLCARGIPDDKILWMAPAF